MYTGIIIDIGRVREVVPGGVTRFVVETSLATDRIALGASIALSGPCFTVVEKAPGWFAVEASRETLALTTAADWQSGTRLNLEQSLKVGDEMGGHYVTGHVDGLAQVTRKKQDGDSWRFRFHVGAALARFIAPKGSVALNGVSLTVNEVIDAADGSAEFGVNIIPHTIDQTTFDVVEVGDRVNVEIDMMARYIARLGTEQPGAAPMPEIAARSAGD